MNLIDISIRRRVTISMFTLAILLFGFVSFFRLKINLLPDLSYPTLTIRTEYAGAAPAEIENLITKPIEEALGVVKNVQQVRSISRAGQSDVLLEFAWGTNMDYASLDVREKLDVLQLPLEVKRPIILRFDPSLDPIMRFGFSRRAALLAPAAPQEQPPKVDLVGMAKPVNSRFNEEELKSLRRFADEQIKKELESALGVAAVKISGGLEDEIHVSVDQARLAQLKLPIEEISRQLGAENINLSGGRLEEGMQQYLVRTLNQFRTVEEIGSVIVANRDATPVYLRDVAAVRHGYREREAITRINGVEAVEIAIYKEGDANTVAVAGEVEKRLEQVRENLPADFELVKVYDQSTFISQAVNEVINAGLVGGALAIIILYFFLRNFATTVIIALSIPVSVIATFNIMYGTNLTLNIMSLGGIALGIGMLVDNSIVVLENISRHRDLGKDIAAAARDGAGEVSLAVTASTLTTVAVFFPLVFVKGIAGQLFRDQALTVTFSLLVSLVVAITLIPMLASLGSRKKTEEIVAPTLPDPKTRAGRWLRKIRLFLFSALPIFFARFFLRASRFISRAMLWILKPLLNIFSRGYAAVENRYPEILRWALGHKGVVLGVAFALFFVSLLMLPVLGVELIPQLSQGEFRVEFRLPPGTTLERTDATIATIQAAAGNIKNIQTTFSVAGSGNRLDANPEEGGENWGELNVAMQSGANRADEEITMARLREDLQRLPGVQYKFGRPTLFTFKTPVEVEVAGFDLDKLKTVSNEIARRMEASPRFADVKSTMESGHPEIQIHFDRERAAALGLAVHQIADRVVDKIRGDVATRYSWRDRKIDVLVRARQEDRDSVERIRKLIVNPQSDRPVPLEAVAEIVVENGPGEIRRIGQERVALVSANLPQGDLGSAAEEIGAIIRHVRTPNGLVVRLAGQNEEMAVSFRSLQLALLLAVFLVYLVMASQFESFLHPFVIMFTIPLALIGAVLALVITGSSLSMVSSYMKHVATTICISLGASLVIAMTIVPLLAARFRLRQAEEKTTLLDKMLGHYGNVLDWTLRHRKTAVGFIFLILASVAAPIAFVKSDMFPPQEDRRLRLFYHMNGNYRLEKVEEAVSIVEDYLLSHKEDFEIRSVYSYYTGNWASSTILLTDDDHSQKSQEEIREEIRAGLPKLAVAILSFDWRRNTGGAEAVRVQLAGESSERLVELSREVARVLAVIPGFKDVRSEAEAGEDEVQVVVNRDRARQYGYSTQEIANTIAAAMRGQNLRRFRDADGETEVRLQFQDTDHQTLDHLRNLPLLNKDGQPTKLATLADFTVRRGPREINREERMTVVGVSANLQGVTVNDAKEKISKALKRFNFPPGYAWNFGQSFSEEEETGQVMLINTLLALALIYFVMAALFESLVFPAAIWTSIIFAIVGVWWFFMITGTTFSLMAWIGVLILMGVVVNNGIVLIDRINQLRAEGISRHEAIAQAGRDRLRPILMTTGTTVLGLVPLCIGTTQIGGDGPPYFPMARAIVGGLTFSTMVTLLVLPTIYVLLDDLRNWATKTIRAAKS